MFNINIDDDDEDGLSVPDSKFCVRKTWRVQ